jgi:membrane associated rhomboid family serine protease
VRFAWSGQAWWAGRPPVGAKDLRRRALPWGPVLADDTTCYRHHDHTAAVACQRCERPICASCMAPASVGFHCPECARAGAQKVIPARTLMNRRARPPVTTALIVINVIAFVVQQSTDRSGAGFSLSNWGTLYGPAVRDGEWWRIVTSGFLHGSLIHLGFNMYALWIFGPNLERMLGPVRFGLAYLAGLLGGGMAVVAFSFNEPTLGASGAVLGLAGALAAALWAQGIKPTQTSLGGIFLINLALPLFMPQISFWGHFGGIASGFAAGWLLTWLPGRYRQSPSASLGAAAVLCLALFAVAVAAATAGV